MDGLGLYYYNARFYAPGLGRFLSADTLVPDPQNPQQYNRYTYSLNSPIEFVDPSGHISCTDKNLGEGDQADCITSFYDQICSGWDIGTCNNSQLPSYERVEALTVASVTYIPL